MQRTVTLTNTIGETLGLMDLIAAHTGEGSLHLAFSVYIFNPEKTKILIQKRSDKKMLWPLAWANTCCSHPLENELPTDAGKRRLQEEMGFTCALKEGPSYVYRAMDPHGNGVEHEYVTTLIGEISEDMFFEVNRLEVADWKWMTLAELEVDCTSHPDLYAPWFPLGLKKILSETL